MLKEDDMDGPPTEIGSVAPQAPPMGAEAGMGLSPAPAGPPGEAHVLPVGEVAAILDQPSGDPKAILEQVAQAGSVDTSQNKAPPGEEILPAETILVGEAAPPESPPSTSEGNALSEDALSQKIQEALTERYTDPADPNKILEDKVKEDFQLALGEEVKDDAGNITNSVEMQLEKILTPEVWSKMTEEQKKSAETTFRANAVQKHIEVNQRNKAIPITEEDLKTLFGKQWFREALEDMMQHNKKFRDALPKNIDYMDLFKKDKKSWFDKLLELLKSMSYLLLMLASITSGSAQQGERKSEHA